MTGIVERQLHAGRPIGVVPLIRSVEHLIFGQSIGLIIRIRQLSRCREQREIANRLRPGIEVHIGALNEQAGSDICGPIDARRGHVE